MEQAKSGEEGNRIVVYPSRWKLALIAIGGLIFVVAGLVMLVGGLSILLARGTTESVMFVFVGFLSVAFFGFGFVYSVHRLAARKPSLVIDEEGIFDDASALGAGLIRWDEVKEIGCYRHRMNLFLGIVPEEAVLRRQSFIKRSFMRLGTGMTGYSISIPQSTLSAKVGDLLAKTEEYRSASSARVGEPLRQESPGRTGGVGGDDGETEPGEREGPAGRPDLPGGRGSEERREGGGIRWGRVAKYATTLFAATFAVGFFAGFAQRYAEAGALRVRPGKDPRWCWAWSLPWRASWCRWACSAYSPTERGSVR